jgi:hypothetical protein
MMNGKSSGWKTNNHRLTYTSIALGDWRYVTKDDIATFGSIAKRQDMLSDQGWIGQEW